MVRLWMHECDRVYRDKLVDEKDMENYDRIQGDISKKTFEVCPDSKAQLLFELFPNTRRFEAEEAILAHEKL